MKSKPVIPPIYLSATYEFDTSDDLIDVVQNRSGFIYSRWDNPTVQEAEKAIAALEGYDEGLGFSSGMAAITTCILSFVSKGDRVIAMREVYGGTHEFIHDFLPRIGIRVVVLSVDEYDRFFEEMEKGVNLLYLESPTNPLLRLIDVKPLSDAAHRKGAVVLLDSTFASPVNQSPKELGVDVAIHSATKYLGGHHDITAGFVCCDRDHFSRIWKNRKILGGTLDANSAFLALRGMKTLELRVQRQNENASKLARFLEDHPRVRRTYYPGLKSHPDHELAKKQMRGFGGMVSFEVDADYEETKQFMDSLRVIKLATSLGGVTSLATQPVTNTHAALSPEARKRAGISESLVRISVGIEDVNILISDIEHAFEAI